MKRFEHSHNGSQTAVRGKATLLLFATLAFAGGSLLTSDFGGFDPNRFPIPQENPPLQPIGFAFSIWFPIYLWLIAGAVFGLTRRKLHPEWNAYRIPLIVSLVIGAPWIEVAKVSPLWSTVMIWVMLAGALLSLYLAPKEDFWWARGPVGLYAGWLTAASCVGTSVLLAGYGILSAQAAAICLLVVSLLMTVTVILTTENYTPTYSCSVLWALVGIIINSVMFSNEVMVFLAGVGVIVVGFTTWNKRQRKQIQMSIAD